MRYLLDTDICIYLIKHHPPEVLNKFRQHRPADVALSTITLFELEYGAEKSRRQQKSRQALCKFLSSFHVLDLDRLAAVEAAAICAKLEQKGTPIGPYDVLIAALAKSRNMILVTNNTREFERVDGLQVENWTKV